MVGAAQRLLRRQTLSGTAPFPPKMYPKYDAIPDQRSDHSVMNHRHILREHVSHAHFPYGWGYLKKLAAEFPQLHVLSHLLHPLHPIPSSRRPTPPPLSVLTCMHCKVKSYHIQYRIVAKSTCDDIRWYWRGAEQGNHSLIHAFSSWVGDRSSSMRATGVKAACFSFSFSFFS